MKSLGAIHGRYPFFRVRRPDPDRIPPRPSRLAVAIDRVFEGCVGAATNPKVVIAMLLLLLLVATWVATEGDRRPSPQAYAYPRSR